MNAWKKKGALIDTNWAKIPPINGPIIVAILPNPPNKDNAFPLFSLGITEAIYACLEIDQRAKLAPANNLEKRSKEKLPLKPANIALTPNNITPAIIVLLSPNLPTSIPAGTSNPIVPKCLAAIKNPTNKSPDPKVSLANIGKTGINNPCPIERRKLGAYTLQIIDLIEKLSLFNTSSVLSITPSVYNSIRMLDIIMCCELYCISIHILNINSSLTIVSYLRSISNFIFRIF